MSWNHYVNAMRDGEREREHLASKSVTTNKQTK